MYAAQFKKDLSVDYHAVCCHLVLEVHRGVREGLLGIEEEQGGGLAWAWLV